MATLQFRKLFKAQTLHKLAGLLDGSYPKEKQLSLMTTDEAFLHLLNNIRKTEVLVIDEISDS